MTTQTATQRMSMASIFEVINHHITENGLPAPYEVRQNRLPSDRDSNLLCVSFATRDALIEWMPVFQIHPNRIMVHDYPDHRAFDAFHHTSVDGGWYGWDVKLSAEEYDDTPSVAAILDGLDEAVVNATPVVVIDGAWLHSHRCEDDDDHMPHIDPVSGICRCVCLKCDTGAGECLCQECSGRHDSHYGPFAHAPGALARPRISAAAVAALPVDQGHRCVSVDCPGETTIEDQADQAWQEARTSQLVPGVPLIALAGAVLRERTGLPLGSVVVELKLSIARAYDEAKALNTKPAVYDEDARDGHVDLTKALTHLDKTASFAVPVRPSEVA